MINLDKIFGNLFESGTPASELHLKNFIQDLLVRIAHYNTAGQYDVMLNELEAVYTIFFGEITNKDIKLALQQSRTRSVDIMLGKFEKEITKIFKTVSLKFASSEPQFQEIFPHGSNEYRDITKTNAETLFTRLSSFGTAHAADFEASFITMLQGYITTYNAARGIQLAAKEDVTGAVLTKSTARINLEITTSLIIFKLAIEFINNPQQGRAFYNQRLLFPSHRNPQGGSDSDYVLPIPINTRVKADFELQNLPDYYLLIANTGTVNAFWYTTDDPNGALNGATPTALAADEEFVKSYAQLGGHKYLFFYTESLDTAGEVTIDQVDAPTV